MYCISLRNACRASQYLIAMVVFASLIQFAYAASPSDAPDIFNKNGSSAKDSHNATYSKTPLKSTITNSPLTDYTDICIFCHLPNMDNHKISAPLWNCTVNVTPATIQKANSISPR